MARSPFITNHARVFLALAEDPSRTVTELAGRAGITERSAFRILADLQRGGYIRRSKRGRRNVYELTDEEALREEMLVEESISALLSLRTARAAASHRETRA